MGIPNLLRILRNITTRQTLSAYRGKRAGIDGYTWLHRSLYCIGDGILKDPIEFFHQETSTTFKKPNNSYIYI